jgi:hypothetical protein
MKAVVGGGDLQYGDGGGSPVPPPGQKDKGE